jgi:hypothetical protein
MWAYAHNKAELHSFDAIQRRGHTESLAVSFYSALIDPMKSEFFSRFMSSVEISSTMILPSKL